MVKNLTPKVLGHISVDAGIVWIGDPCYILHRNLDEVPTSIGRSWSEFCDELGTLTHKSFDHDMVGEGLGVCTSTKHGDGYYPVIGFFDGDSTTPSCVMVDFDNVIGEL